jgi:hypothetical protein
MQSVTVAKEEIFEMLTPFQFEENLIYSIELETDDKIYRGLFGFGKNKIFFRSYEDLPDNLTIDIGESAEELQEFLTAVEYIIQKISLSGKKIFIQGIDDKIETKYILPYFINTVKDYERNIREIERIKYGD